MRAVRFAVLLQARDRVLHMLAGAGEVMVADRRRDLSWDERIRSSGCPVCHAPDGEPCHAEVGFQLGQRVDGRHMQTGEGAHLGRLQRAPTAVREVPCG